MKLRVDYAPCVIGQTTYPRPYLDVVLRSEHGHRETFSVDALVDTGSDLCVFDWAIAHMMGFDPHSVGMESNLAGLGSSEPQLARIVPITLYVPRLKRAFPLNAQFCQIAGNLGVAGLLGHVGFLDQFSITFARGEYFEIIDDQPGTSVSHLKPVR